MTDIEIPPPGPARDRLVAEAVGWGWIDKVAAAHDYAKNMWYFPSTSDHDALAALDAWWGNEGRWYVVRRWKHDDGVSVTLYDGVGSMPFGSAPTLREAASAALARWALDRREEG